VSSNTPADRASNGGRAAQAGRRLELAAPARGTRSAVTERNQRPLKTAEILARRIVAAITKDGLVPGDRLPPEADMVASFEVGRGTLREALRYLELQGILTIKPGFGGGPVVAMPSASSLASSFTLVLQAAHTPFSTIVRSRTMLEPLVAQEAAHNAKNAEAEGLLEALSESVDAIAATLGDTDGYLSENAHFHELVAQASGNLLFTYLMGSLHWIIDGSSLGVQYPDTAKKVTIKAHRDIFEAIAAGNAERAFLKMRLHNERFERYLAETYADTLNQTVRWD
jgi:GntR family transcriptional repressor for pyruvate dehydrogenase complex